MASMPRTPILPGLNRSSGYGSLQASSSVSDANNPLLSTSQQGSGSNTPRRAGQRRRRLLSEAGPPPVLVSVPADRVSLSSQDGVPTRRLSRRNRLLSGSSDIMNSMERFNRRTLSTASVHSHDISAEVDALMAGTDGMLEDDVIEEEAGGGECDVRDSENAISNFETIIHLLKGNIGIGVLTLPVAIKNSGLVLGSLGLVFIAVVCIFCMRILVGASNSALRTRPHVAFLDYADTAKACFEDAGGWWAKCSKFMYKLVNTFLILTQFGSNAVYVLFIAQNIRPIFVQNAEETFGDLNYRYYILMVLPPMLLICSIRNLRYLSPFSILANIIQFLGLGIIFFYLFSQPLPNSHSVPWVADLDRLPLFFGTAIFAIEGICVVLPIENQMRHPKDMLTWNGVLNTSMILIVCLYIAVGFYGYLVYGDDIKSTITLNLPPEDILAQVTMALFSLAIFFSYALQFYVLMEIVGPNLLRPMMPNASEGLYSLAEYSTRVVINVLTFCMAATVPWLDLLVSLLGAVKMSTLAIMAPALIDSAVQVAAARSEGMTNKTRMRLVRNGLIFAFGLFGMIMGTYVSMLNIVENFKNGGGE